MRKGQYYTGSSGLLLPVRNKDYYPDEFKDKSRLCYYGSLFNSIEVNSSFYKVPMATTVSRWAADVPDEFRFTFKLLRDITHSKDLVFDDVMVQDFITRIGKADNKKGCLLVQFPGSIRKNIHLRQVELLFQSICNADYENGFKKAIEFRHSSWYTGEIYELLQKYQMGMVVHDKLTTGGSIVESSTDFVYLRFHGPGGDYRGSYSDDFLYEYATYIDEWLQEGKDVYCYFNNTMGGAIENLAALRKYVVNLG